MSANFGCNFLETESTTTTVSLESLNTNKTTENMASPKINCKITQNKKVTYENSVTFYRLSAMYGKILVVLGLVFPITEAIIPDKIPYVYHVCFYMFLYIGSIIFLVYAHIVLVQSSVPSNLVNRNKGNMLFWIFSSKKIASKNNYSPDQISANKISDLDVPDMEKNNPKPIIGGKHTGPMYLKMGAVIFGMGGMIYNGLEVGQWIELRSDENCNSPLQIMMPITSMIYTFSQMYFIFLSSKIAIKRNFVYIQFGLMHVLGTNLCNWLRILVKETKNDIDDINSLAFIKQHIVNVTDEFKIKYNYDINVTGIQVVKEIPDKNSEHGGYIQSYHCRHSHIIGNLIENSSPFLFPCTIEFSLLCSAVLYIIWKSTLNRKEVEGRTQNSEEPRTFHHYSVDCTSSGHGLFIGIILVVFTIISLIVFFVFIGHDKIAYKNVAIIEAEIMELILYGLASVASVVSMIQMRQLKAVPKSNMELDNILLLSASSAIYLYASFTFVASYFQNGVGLSRLVSPITTSVAQFVQTCLQTLLIIDASHRCCVNQDHATRKPGRQLITFLLLCNLDLWAVNTFETSRADAHPVQLEFYGAFTWVIISHATMPLVIFYRFHCTVCLCEIWKSSYKLNQQ